MAAVSPYSFWRTEMYSELKTDSPEAIGVFLAQMAVRDNAQATITRKGDEYIVEAWHADEPEAAT